MKPAPHQKPASHHKSDPAKPEAQGRDAALRLLQAVLHRKRPLDDALADKSIFGTLAARDRAFAHNLTATTLRRLGQIDQMLRLCVPRPLPAAAGPVQDILRLGVAQLVFLGTAAHAAVDQAVAMTGQAGQTKMKSLVNAVLRRMAREGLAMAQKQDAVRLNTPNHLWHAWSDAYGEATARAIAEAHLGEAPLDITVKRDADLWAERLDAQILPTGSLRRKAGGAVADLPGFADGAWWIQDAAAALPARLLGDVAGQTVIDLCAAPGGKTAQLAAAGAKVTAVDRSAARLERVAANLKRLKLDAELVAADAAIWRPAVPADAVLLDAPCTATGTIRRHPDIPHLKSADDLRTMTALQDRLLAAAADMLRPGGALVYCTCSLQPEEGPARIERALAEQKMLRREAIEPAALPAEFRTPAGELRTLPSQWRDLGGIDGFYAARLRKLS
ncbi:MAG: RsmB/NOP family class I SAM-dependent RNA methyltransferase [Alphaproteobacteria bacterium]